MRESDTGEHWIRELGAKVGAVGGPVLTLIW